MIELTPRETNRRHACIVLGMHRSGTSAITGVLAHLGASLPRRLNPPAADNPEGYFEPAELVSAHDDLLAAADSAWFDPDTFDAAQIPPDILAALVSRISAALVEDYAGAVFPLIKDPRISRFVPLFRAILIALGLQPSVVIALRPPAEVAASLAQRDQLSSPYSGLLWARHLIEAERNTRDQARAIVSYDELFTGYDAVVGRVAALPGNWVRPAGSPPPVHAALRHQRDLPPNTVFGSVLGPLLTQLHDSLAALARQDGPDQQATVDAAAAPVLAEARRRAGALQVEYMFQRSTATNPAMRASDPVAERRHFAAAIQALHGP